MFWHQIILPDLNNIYNHEDNYFKVELPKCKIFILSPKFEEKKHLSVHCNRNIQFYNRSDRRHLYCTYVR